MAMSTQISKVGNLQCCVNYFHNIEMNDVFFLLLFTRQSASSVRYCPKRKQERGECVWRSVSQVTSTPTQWRSEGGIVLHFLITHSTLYIFVTFWRVQKVGDLSTHHLPEVFEAGIQVRVMFERISLHSNIGIDKLLSPLLKFLRDKIKFPRRLVKMLKFTCCHFPQVALCTDDSGVFATTLSKGGLASENCLNPF